jgi:putative copper resistance protein D
MLAAALVGTLAWSGHAAGTPGVVGTLHRASDFIHLVAAAAWIGALIPLAVLLAFAPRYSDAQAPMVTREAVVRFSAIGVASVLALLATGAFNTWAIVHSLHTFVATTYGRLLLAKVALFCVMLVFAATNRLWLTPRLMSKATSIRNVPLWIEINAVVEAIIGAIILLIVGLLGTLDQAEL